MTTIKQTGFAPAATPHAATAVHTSDENIVSGETSIPSQGITCRHSTPARGTSTARCRSSSWFRKFSACMNIFAIFAAVWRKRGIWLSLQSCTSAVATLMITATSLLCSGLVKSAGLSSAGRPRSRGQLGLPPRRRCPSPADYRLLLGRAHYGCTLRITRS